MGVHQAFLGPVVKCMARYRRVEYWWCFPFLVHFQTSAEVFATLHLPQFRGRVGRFLKVVVA